MNREPVHFDYNDLRVAVAKLSIVVQKKAIVPACEHILFQCDGSEARMTSTDMKTIYTTVINCEGASQFTLDAVLINKVLSLSKDSVTVSIHPSDGPHDSEVRVGSSSYIIQGHDPLSYPILKVPEYSIEQEMSASDLSSAIKFTEGGRGREETMNRHGFCFDSRNGVAGVYTYNGFCCHSYSMECDMEAKFTIPPTFAMVIKKLKGDFLTLGVSDKFASITCGSDSFSCLLIDANTPDYRRVMSGVTNMEMTCVVTIEASYLSPAVEKCLIFSEQEYECIEFSFEEDALSMFSGTLDMGEAREVVPNWTFDGQPVSMAFNGGAVRDMLGQIDGLIKISLFKTDRQSGMVIESINDPAVQHVCTALSMDKHVDRKPRKSAQIETDFRSKKEKFESRMS